MDERELKDRISANLGQVRGHLDAAARKAGRSASDVLIVAVTKTFPAEVVRAAVEAGLGEIGENRVQEARDKRAALGKVPGVRWHLIGHLQRNKAALALSLFDLIHSVDSLELAQELERRAAGRLVPVLIEINVAAESTKFGFHLEVQDPLFSAVEGMLALPHLRLEGLMTVAPLVDDPEKVRPIFARLHALREELRRRYPEAPWTHLSMGMTDDYVVAVEEGATIVRLGRALFGARGAAAPSEGGVGGTNSLT